MQPLRQVVVFISEHYHPNKLKYTDIHKEIVEACKAGNRQAQYRLYQLYSKGMYNVCLRMLASTQDAEDILQNSFIDVFTKLHMFRFESSIGAWIKRIVVNNCINFLKKKRLVISDLSDQNIPEEIVVDKNEYEKILQIEQIKRAIPKLSDGYRVVLSLYLLEGYDHQEIAEILKVTVSTSKSQLNRAKKKLKEIILEELQTDYSNARPA